MEEKEKKKLALSKIVLIIAAIVGLFFVVWLAWIRPTENISSFQECVDAGNPVQESFPEVCVTPEGKRFTNSSQ